MNEILKYLSKEIKNKILEYMQIHKEEQKKIEEIRLRVERPIILKIGQESKILKFTILSRHILETFEKVCENSVYSYKNQISQGFITIKGGNRVGIVGSTVIENGIVTNINYISSLNFRISHEVIGCSIPLLDYVVDSKNNTIYNTLIVAKPGKGKTTILRDLIRNVSNGSEKLNLTGKTCGVVDERGEIAAMYRGVPQNDLGLRTDVLDNVPKNIGMHMLIRSMAPDIIACDEIGSKEDIEAILYAIYSGTKGIFTAHGDSIESLKKNNEISKLMENNIIERIILLKNHESFEILF